jgi:hypothetical protein
VASRHICDIHRLSTAASQNFTSTTRPTEIHGELLMLGFEVAQSTVSKYMV